MGKVKELSGNVYGRLTVISFSHMVGEASYWNCICTCGTQKKVRRNRLTCGVTVSCGCYRLEKSIEASRIHGESKTRGNTSLTKEYRTWMHIKQRCLNPKTKGYHNYGGRGISVCDRWISSYQNFLIDMGRAPSPKHSIERVSSNGNYCPENCKWIPLSDQQKNRRPYSEWKKRSSLLRH
jgi:hypothetical protein